MIVSANSIPDVGIRYYGRGEVAMLISRASTSFGALTAAPIAWLAMRRMVAEKMVVENCILAGSGSLSGLGLVSGVGVGIE